MNTNESCECQGQGCCYCDILLGAIEFNSDLIVASEKVKTPLINNNSRNGSISQSSNDLNFYVD